LKVILLSHTPRPDEVVALAARLCYSRAGVEELARGLSGKDVAAFIGMVVSRGHHSVLEHAVFSFGVEGISRAASHQLVRHRLASYSQKSQRYVVEEEPFEYVLPESIAGGEDLAREYRETMCGLHEFYSRLLAGGVPAEDARYVLPNAATTQILVTMNARELRHFFSLRLCLRAQWEIRELAAAMLREALRTAPVIFEGAGPACVDGPCPEGEKTCGRIKEMRRQYRRSEERDS
jgi:thymidylate synthase (FAD)